MNQQQFTRLMTQARAVPGDYSTGYQRGLRRHFHGEQFGTDEEHKLWSSMGLHGDHRHELGRGYRDGITGVSPRGSSAGPVERRDHGNQPDAARYYDPSPEYLRELLAASGLSQREAARRVGIPERSMRCYLADREASTAQTAPYTVQVALEELTRP